MSKTHRISLGGLDFIPGATGALYCPDHRALLVADLHLEKATSLARRGLHLPPYDTRATLADLAAAGEAVKPGRLICLGDSFHDEAALERIDAADLKSLEAICASVSTIWIAGNHDPAIPGLPGLAAAETFLGPVILRHIPAPDLSNEFEIAGHLHPAAAVIQRGRHLRRKCFAVSSERIVMPAFGSFTGSLDIGDPAFTALFKVAPTAFLLGRGTVHKLPPQRTRRT